MGPQRVLDSCPRTFEGNCDLGMFHAAGAQLDDPGATGLDDVAGLPTGYLTPRAVIAGSSAIPSLIAHWRTTSLWQPRERP